MIDFRGPEVTVPHAGGNSLLIRRKQSIVVTCIVIIALGAIFPMLEGNAAIAIVGFALVSAIYTLVALGVYTYLPELFPTPIRLRGTGFCSLCGRAASVASPLLTVVAYRAAGLVGVLTIVCGLLLALIGVSLLVNVETSSRSLEDIGHTDELAGDSAVVNTEH